MSYRVQVCSPTPTTVIGNARNKILRGKNFIVRVTIVAFRTVKDLRMKNDTPHQPKVSGLTDRPPVPVSPPEQKNPKLQERSRFAPPSKELDVVDQKIRTTPTVPEKVILSKPVSVSA